MCVCRYRSQYEYLAIYDPDEALVPSGSELSVAKMVRKVEQFAAEKANKTWNPERRPPFHSIRFNSLYMHNMPSPWRKEYEKPHGLTD
jgi:hypothetical protein